MRILLVRAAFIAVLFAWGWLAFAITDSFVLGMVIVVAGGIPWMYALDDVNHGEVPFTQRRLRR